MNVPHGNRLLDALTDRDAAHVAATRIVALKRGETSTLAGHVMQHVDFPLTALMSVSGSLENGTTYEVASVGSEGFVEIDAALGADVALRNAACQFDGEVARMSLREFQTALETSKAFALLVRRAVRARVFVTEQIAMCNLKHTIVQRLARWLLLSQDRLQRPELDVTHDFLATILGVRRAGVSVAAAELEQQGAIAQFRGNVGIRNVDRLVDAACECYSVSQQQIAESLGRTQR